MKWFKTEKQKEKYIQTIWNLYHFSLREKNKGFVYLLSCGKYTKIGRAKDVNKRFYQVSTATPYEVKLLASKEVENCVLLEDILHSSLRDFCIKGEWFELEETLVLALTKLLNAEQ